MPDKARCNPVSEEDLIVSSLNPVQRIKKGLETITFQTLTLTNQKAHFPG